MGPRCALGGRSCDTRVAAHTHALLSSPPHSQDTSSRTSFYESQGPGWQRPGISPSGPLALASRALRSASRLQPQYLADMSQVLGLCVGASAGLCLYTHPTRAHAHTPWAACPVRLWPRAPAVPEPPCLAEGT